MAEQRRAYRSGHRNTPRERGARGVLVTHRAVMELSYATIYKIWDNSLSGYCPEVQMKMATAADKEEKPLSQRPFALLALLVSTFSMRPLCRHHAMNAADIKKPCQSVTGPVSDGGGVRHLVSTIFALPHV